MLGRVSCVQALWFEEPCCKFTASSSWLFIFSVVLPKSWQTLSERICAYIWCTPWGSFLSISLEIPTKVSKWEDWQQSTPPKKTPLCSSLSQSCWLSSVSRVKAQGKLQAPFSCRMLQLLLSSKDCHFQQPYARKEYSPLTNLSTFTLQILSN